MTFTSILLQTVGPALLPREDDDNGDNNNHNNNPQPPTEYYAVLGLPKYASLEQIRTAYKKKSLQLHPDKIQQRRGRDHPDDAQQAALEYERVQTAYAVLSDPHARQRYHAWHCQPARYQFVEHQHGLSNPMALHGNMQRAHWLDRLRLFVCTAVLLLLVVLLQPILIAAKVNAIGNSEHLLHHVAWIYIFIPCWILGGLYSGILAVGTVVTWQEARRRTEPLPAAAALLEGDDDWWSLLGQLLEQLLFLAGWIVLSLQWDRPFDDKWDWHATVAAPFYAAVAVRLMTLIRGMRRLRYACHIMVSVEHVQRQIRTDIDDWDEFLQNEQRHAEQVELLSQHIVVTTQTAAVAVVLELARPEEEEEWKEEDVEAVRVQTSPEYRAARRALRSLHRALGQALCRDVAFIALTAAKLEEQIDVSWWVVFVPFWVSQGLPFLLNWLACCCGGGPPMDDDDEDEDANDDDRNETVEPKEGDEEQPAETKTENNTNNAVKASVAFASPEGEMEEFNEKVVIESNETETTAEAGEKLQSPLAAEIAQQVEEAKAILEKAQAAAAAVSRPKKDEETGLGGETGQGDDDVENVNDDDNDAKEEEEEEAFRRWQEHMRGEAGSEYMEQQVKSLSGCCSLCFQLILLCLIVAKLEADYSDVGETFDDEDDLDGYNAFWVLFPIFFIAGILLLCCAGCIFAREDKAMPNATAASNSASGEENPGQDTIIPPAPLGAMVPNSVESSQHDGSVPGEGNSSGLNTTASNLGSSHHADPVLTEEGVEASNHSTMDDID